MIFKHNSAVAIEAGAETMKKMTKKSTILNCVTNHQVTLTGDDEIIKREWLIVVSNNINDGYTIENKESQTYQPLQEKKQWVGESTKLLADNDEISTVGYNDDDDDFLLLKSKCCRSQDQEEIPTRSLSAFSKETVKTTGLTIFDEDKESDNDNNYFCYDDDKNVIIRTIPTLLSSYSQQKRLSNEINSIFRTKANSLEELSEVEEDDLLVFKRANPIHDDNSIAFEDDDDDLSYIDSFPHLEQARPINDEYWVE